MRISYEIEMKRFHLFDIEGTITPIDFVKKKLFPYSNEHFEEFISPEIISDVYNYIQEECPHDFKPNFEVKESNEYCLKVLRWVFKYTLYIQ